MPSLPPTEYRRGHRPRGPDHNRRRRPFRGANPAEAATAERLATPAVQPATAGSTIAATGDREDVSWRPFARSQKSEVRSQKSEKQLSDP